MNERNHDDYAKDVCNVPRLANGHERHHLVVEIVLQHPHILVGF
jgi:hypothetical protein